MRRHAAAGGENALRRQHAFQVLGAGFGAAQHHALAALGRRIGGLGGEHQASARRAWAGRQATGEGHGLGQRRLVERGGEQRVDGVGGNLHERRVARQQAFVVHLHGDAHGGEAGALAGARLQHVELAFLDGELEVLHVLEVRFQLVAHGQQFGVQGGHLFGEVGNRMRGAHAGHHVFALGVRQVFAVERAFAGGRIAGEGNAGCAARPAIAEHHRLHVHGGSPGARDAVALAIEHGAFVRPGAEHGADRAPELLGSVLRKRLAGAGLNQRLVALDQAHQVRRVEVGVALGAHLGFQRIEQRLERIAALGGIVGDAQHDIAVHGDEAAIAVVGEAFVVALRGQSGHGVVVQPQVEDGVHHPRHGLPRPGAHRHQQRIRRRAEALPLLRLQCFEMAPNGLAQPFGIGLLVVVVVRADRRGDREPRRHRQPDARHLR